MITSSTAGYWKQHRHQRAFKTSSIRGQGRGKLMADLEKARKKRFFTLQNHKHIIQSTSKLVQALSLSL